jgi:hypothetical protein
MRTLYDFGHDLAASGNLWSNYPPYFAPRDNDGGRAMRRNTLAQTSN